MIDPSICVEADDNRTLLVYLLLHLLCCGATVVTANIVVVSRTHFCIILVTFVSVCALQFRPEILHILSDQLCIATMTSLRVLGALENIFDTVLWLQLVLRLYA